MSLIISPQNTASSTLCRGRARVRRGQILVETAFILPILLLFTLGTLQFGLTYSAKLALQHACREGARYASVHAREKPLMVSPFSTADDLVEAKVIAVAQKMGVGINTSNVTVGPSLPNTSSSTSNRPLYGTVTVTITYDMNRRRIIPRGFYLPVGKGTMITLPIFDGPYTVSETAVMEGADVA